MNNIRKTQIDSFKELQDVISDRQKTVYINMQKAQIGQLQVELQN